MRTLSRRRSQRGIDGRGSYTIRANGLLWMAIVILLVLTTPTVDSFTARRQGASPVSRRVSLKATAADSSDCATTSRREHSENLKQVAKELEGTFKRSGEAVAVIEREENESDDDYIAAEAGDNEDDELAAESAEQEDAADDEVASSVAEARRRRAAASLLLKSSGRRRKVSSTRKTSVGQARVGSATRARQTDVNKASKIFKGIERAASASSKEEEKESKKGIRKEESSLAAKHPSDSPSPVVQSAIDGLIMQEHEAVGQNPEKNMANMALHVPRWSDMHRLLSDPPPGTILMDNDISMIRLATMEDDEFIADLRLSVFSDFGPSFRQQFNSRSQQVLASRRLRGATCLVASNIFSNERVVGSVEVSIHEFHGTLLGRSRLPESMLYITEVAVHPDSRRCGLGRKLLEAVDELGRRRGTVESLYLHVDVTNTAAIRLYESCGYRRMDPSLPMYEEFTRSLDLHDGATKGRKHHLLCKDIVRNPTWLLDEASPAASRPQLGFEIPQ